MWPTQLRYLVQAHGADVVWQSGLQTLGYPPTWIHSTNEALRVAGSITQGEES